VHTRYVSAHEKFESRQLHTESADGMFRTQWKSIEKSDSRGTNTVNFHLIDILLRASASIVQRETMKHDKQRVDKRASTLRVEITRSPPPETLAKRDRTREPARC